MRLAICMLVLGIETSCDETGLALYSGRHGLLAHALHSQVEMHREYGGVVPELASRDHIRRVLPLLERILRQADVSPAAIDAVAFTQGLGLCLGAASDWHPPSGRPSALAIAGVRAAVFPLCGIARIGRSYPIDGGERGGRLSNAGRNTG